MPGQPKAALLWLSFGFISPPSQNRACKRWHTANTSIGYCGCDFMSLTQAQEETSFSLNVLPPFRLDLTVWVLRRRPENKMDRWDGKTYRRALVLNGKPAEVAVTQRGSPEAPRLQASVIGVEFGSETKSKVTQALNWMLRSEEHTSELQSQFHLVCRLLLEKK